jgi:hypothetical protein
MQYLVSVIFDREGLATEDEDAAIDVFNDRLVAEGHWVFGGGLAAPASATVIDNRGDEAVHTSARDVRATDWSQIVALYDQLVRLDPSPVIALNRAIALAELDGPEVALAAVDRLERELSGYHAYHATRARPAAPARPQPAVTRGVQPGHRPGGQHRRDRLPHPPPRPAWVTHQQIRRAATARSGCPQDR